MDQLFAERSAADEKVCCADCRQREVLNTVLHCC